MRVSLGWCLLLLCGCATSAPVGAGFSALPTYQPFAPPAAPRPPPAVPDHPVASPATTTPGAREAAVDIARRLVGQKTIIVKGKRFGDDCTGLVRAVYAQVGIDLMSEARREDNGVSAMYRYAGAHGRIYEGGRPLPGDIVFFKETYDYNRDGRINDGLTHVGVVDEVEEDGTVVVIHRVARGVVRYRMNLAHRDVAASPDGRRWNDWLRAKGPNTEPQLTGQLFAGYATLLPVEPQLVGARLGEN